MSSPSALTRKDAARRQLSTHQAGASVHRGCQRLDPGLAAPRTVGDSVTEAWIAECPLSEEAD